MNGGLELRLWLPSGTDAFLNLARLASSLCTSPNRTLRLRRLFARNAIPLQPR
jgi:hypothetical protein